MPIELDERGRALENEYFHRKEQELLSKMKDKIAGDEATNLEANCPKCDGTLYETDFENITIDVCNKCTGVWLDAGELADRCEGRNERRMVWEILSVNGMKNTAARSFFAAWLTIAVSVVAASGQLFGVYDSALAVRQPAAEVESHKLASKLMAREVPYRVILPSSYRTPEAAAVRYPVVYLLHGLYGHYDNWTDKTALARYANSYNLIIVTPEGGNGWYTDSVSAANDKYESYIVRELIPEIDKKYRTRPDRLQRAIAGLSMGGYGGMKFGLKYPEMFSLAGSFSGALAATTFTEKAAGAIAKSVDLTFGPPETETRKANDIFRIVRELTPERTKALPFLYLDCGTEDFLIQSNRDFIQLLNEKKVPHEFRELPGAHDWKYWDKQVQEFLRVADRILGPGQTPPA